MWPMRSTTNWCVRATGVFHYADRLGPTRGFCLNGRDVRPKKPVMSGYLERVRRNQPQLSGRTRFASSSSNTVHRQSSTSGNASHVKDGPQIPRDEHIQAVEKIIKYKFKDHSLLHEALQAAGFLTIEGNKGLALVGDSVLRLLIVLDGYAKNKIKGMNAKSITPSVVVLRLILDVTRTDQRHYYNESQQRLSLSSGLRSRLRQAHL